MRTTLTMALVLTSLTLAHAQEAGHRELAAHAHGVGALNIAIEGNALNMELSVPADDIVGFEHAAKTKKQKAALAKARKTLAEPLGLFVVPPAAGCTLKKSEVKFTHDNAKGKKHSHGHSHGHDHGKGAKKDTGHKHDDTHAEFDATYAIECTTPAQLTTMAFPFFEIFPKSQKLQVNIISAKGQSRLEATPKQRTLSLAGKL